MPRPALRSSLLGAFTLLSALALVATPGCLNTSAVSCGDDGFCPPGTVCTPKQDPPVCVPARGCGNGEVDDAAGEVCDDGNIEDGDGCNSTCTSEEVCGNRFVDRQLKKPEECDDGRETRNCNEDCTLAECGDGKVNETAGEVCDDGNTKNGDGCDKNCQSEECGNGRVEQDFGEQCDDGNNENNDGCSANCKNELCGNGRLDPGEKCDEPPDSDAVDNHNDACIVLSATECFVASCGDGHVWKDDCKGKECEECDDEGESEDCNADCTKAECGDGKVNRTRGEACDDSGDSPSCDDDCTFARCGDGYTNEEAGEQCDGGGVDTATCNKDCTLAKCHDSYVNTEAGEECDTALPTSFCNDECKLTECGDGIIDVGEQCDTSGQSATCNFNCSNAMCGDGIVNSSFVVNPLHASDTTATEQCDPGTGTTGNLQRASTSSPACDRDCTFARCGDGYENPLAGEQCDDVYVASGPKTATDSCNADCTAAACGDGKLNSGFIVDLFETSATLTGKECDPGTGTSGDKRRAQADNATCDADCSAVRCGDGHRNQTAGEECDSVYYASGPPDATATCDTDCTFAECGDGVVNNKFEIRLLHDNVTTYNQEQCDPGTGTTLDDNRRALADIDVCDRDCSTVRCGDAYINAIAGEECEHSYEWRHWVQPADTSSCYSNCRVPRCGDGRVFNHLINEICDPDTGPTTNRTLASANSATCDLDCTLPQCGDGRANALAGEQCDPNTGATGNAGMAFADSATCNRNCTAATCGDSYVNAAAGEECDDGNAVSGDGCDANCNNE